MRPFLTSMFAVVVGLAGANRILADAPLPEIPPVPAITGANAAPEAPKPDLPPAAELLPQLFPLSEFAFTDRAPSSPLDSLLSLTTEPVPDPVAATGAPCDCPPVACPSLPSFGGPLCSRPTLTGDWGGLRPRLAANGLNFNIYETNFFGDVANGGAQETFQHRGRTDVLANINGAQAGLWRGSFIDLHAESIYGRSINPSAGTLSPVSIAQLVPVPNGNVTALTGVKFTQFITDQFIVYGGKLNLLDGFNQPFTGGARGVDGFWNGAMVFNQVLARTLPYSTYGFGGAYLQNLQPILSMTVLDANNTPTTSGFNSFFANGAVLLPQVNIPTNFFGLPGHQGFLGTWSSKQYTPSDRTAFLNVLQGTPLSTQSTQGAWSLAYMFDQALYVSPCDPNRKWGMFGNLGLADTNPSPVRWFANIGLGGASPLRGRPLDTFGMGYYYLGLNSSFKNLAPATLPLRDENGVEAFYNVGITPWCHITPDVQFILPAAQRAEWMWFFGLRAKITF
jgi:porin